MNKYGNTFRQAKLHLWINLTFVIYQLYCEKGLGAIIKHGYKVIIKVNLVGPNLGQRGEKGRSIITDPRILRYVAEKVRDIPNPSPKWK